MNEALKRCPFCGGEAVLERRSRAFINARTERIPLEKYGKSSSSYEANAEAIAAWNRRAESGK